MIISSNDAVVAVMMEKNIAVVMVYVVPLCTSDRWLNNISF
jgi:hypothetical protein